MIISASRRTDIPAFYSSWFMDRIRDGEVLVKNPYNPERSRRVLLNPEAVECIVFWTRWAGPLEKYLKELSSLGFRYYFLFTLNGYDKSMEPHLPGMDQQVESFRKISELIGPDKIQWRYDPIILTEKYPAEIHLEVFRKICGRLQSFTNQCITSFVTPYRKCRKKLEILNYRMPPIPEQLHLLREMREIAGKHQIKLSVCASENDFSEEGIPPSRCIDAELISQITGKEISYQNDKNQRSGCHCHQSTDIGEYGTCRFGCIYCYAS